LEDNFSLAISAYALSINKDFEIKNDILEDLKKKANIHDDKMFWDRKTGGNVSTQSEYT
jgi:hypothetical protein